MDDLSMKRIDTVKKKEWEQLIEESKAEGTHYLTRLKREYAVGENPDQDMDEVLFGVYHVDGRLLAIGGLCEDLYGDDSMGRIRRFYVSPPYRQKGLGSWLLAEIIAYAKHDYEWLVLFADTETASQFYFSQGFLETVDHVYATHFLKI